MTHDFKVELKTALDDRVTQPVISSTRSGMAVHIDAETYKVLHKAAKLADNASCWLPISEVHRIKRPTFGAWMPDGLWHTHEEWPSEYCQPPTHCCETPMLPPAPERKES